MRDLRLFSALSWVALFAVGAAAPAAEVRSRLAILVDTAGRMLLTPEFRTVSETCNWNPCTFGGNPSAAQEACNACTRDTVRFDSTCGGANSWDAACRSLYAMCHQAVAGPAACSGTLSVETSLTTRGDGSTDLPGCDLNGDGSADDSRLLQAKSAVGDVVDAHPEVAYSLWRFSQVQGGQACTTDTDCPEAPGGLRVLTCEDVPAGGPVTLRCVLDADRLDGPTTAGFEGQCARFTWTGSPETFSCAACDFVNGYDRAICEAFGLDRSRTGAASLLDGSTVQCFPLADPAHRFQSRHGAFSNGSSCDPLGGESLVDFPACDPAALCDNRAQIASWLDGDEAVFGQDPELRASGGRPLAAALRDLRESLLAELTADLHSACRRYEVIAIAGGAENCESAADVTAAASALQDLSFTNAAGIFVADYDVPVHFVGLGSCAAPPPASCAASQELDDAAAAAGTSAAWRVQNEAELAQRLALLSEAAVPVEVCNLIDDDCDGDIDESPACDIFSDGFETGDTTAWSTPFR